MEKLRTAQAEFDALSEELRRQESHYPEVMSATKINVLLIDDLRVYLDAPDRELMKTIYARALDLHDELQSNLKRYPGLAEASKVAERGAAILDDHVNEIDLFADV